MTPCAKDSDPVPETWIIGGGRWPCATRGGRKPEGKRAVKALCDGFVVSHDSVVAKWGTPGCKRCRMILKGNRGADWIARKRACLKALERAARAAKDEPEGAGYSIVAALTNVIGDRQISDAAHQALTHFFLELDRRAAAFADLCLEMDKGATTE